jgi:peroxiredoxin
MRSDDLYSLPKNIPEPVDDGAAEHLPGMQVPYIPLFSTRDEWVDVSRQSAQFVILFCYPRTGLPDRELPKGWNQIPGARGCTPECIGFRHFYGKLRELDCAVFGLSTQPTAYQKEMADRLDLPFAVLSDCNLALTNALRLPTFIVDEQALLKRLTMVIRRGTIHHVFYPVFPPDRHAEEVLDWLQATHHEHSESSS